MKSYMNKTGIVAIDKVHVKGMKRDEGQIMREERGGRTRRNFA
jgi:hypothetical protein